MLSQWWHHASGMHELILFNAKDLISLAHSCCHANPVGKGAFLYFFFIFKHQHCPVSLKLLKVIVWKQTLNLLEKPTPADHRAGKYQKMLLPLCLLLRNCWMPSGSSTRSLKRLAFISYEQLVLIASRPTLAWTIALRFFQVSSLVVHKWNIKWVMYCQTSSLPACSFPSLPVSTSISVSFFFPIWFQGSARTWNVTITTTCSPFL